MVGRTSGVVEEEDVWEQAEDLVTLRGHRQATRRSLYDPGNVILYMTTSTSALTLLPLGTWPPHWGRLHEEAPAPVAPVLAEPSLENTPALDIFSAGAPISQSRE